MAYRYKYQVVRALDDKIGPDLRGIVEGYLGPDSELARRHHSIHNVEMIKGGIVAWFGMFSTFLGCYRDQRGWFSGVDRVSAVDYWRHSQAAGHMGGVMRLRLLDAKSSPCLAIEGKRRGIN